MKELYDAPLGKKSAYVEQYDPSLLYPVPRQINRDALGLPNPLPFHGWDIWNSYELSWLNPKGKPMVALGKLIFPADSQNIVESKSLKLYFNSFNQSHFESPNTLQECIKNDLSKAVGAQVEVNIQVLTPDLTIKSEPLCGICLDDQDIEVHHYQFSPEYLCASGPMVDEVLYSNLLKSNCLMTNQPDWGTVFIHYQGTQIDKEGLLRYIVSFRRNNEFAEQCVERIFNDISKQCHPKQLTVYARFTRRGGLDINPFRSTFEECWENNRFIRQ